MIYFLKVCLVLGLTGSVFASCAVEREDSDARRHMEARLHHEEALYNSTIATGDTWTCLPTQQPENLCVALDVTRILVQVIKE
ncbi:MAG: hypothetical protein C0514_00415 [Candidatus Puniceispirillum sp.]|nr:hypothetical protein [Candidatus Puniceispirillum sp.]